MEDQLSAVVFIKVWACIESSQKFFMCKQRLVVLFLSK